MRAILDFLGGLPPVVIYLVLGVGAGLENVVPPIPADTFVLLGGFLAALGRADPVGVFVSTWGFNVGSALAVYALGRHYGRSFFEEGWGRRLLDPRQLERLDTFYERWGVLAIFFTRFLPGFRAVVPVFAGVTHQRLLPVALPLAVASALWYGALVWLGATAGRNLDTITGWISDANRLLLAIAIVLAGLVAWWWWRTRHASDREGGEDR